MKIIQTFLTERIAPGPNKVNAPTFIYWILHGKYPSPPMAGRDTEHEHKLINGIPIDKYIPEKPFKDILKIKEIETRSSCQGESKDKPTFLIIRLNNSDEEMVKKFVENMNKFSDVKCGYDIGNMGRPRIGITTSLWYEKNPNRFVTWWIALPKKIKTAIRNM